MNLIFLVFLIVIFPMTAWSLDLSTIAEKSQWTKTGRVEEAQNLCRQFSQKFPSRIKCLSYGVSPEKRNLPYLVIGNPEAPTVWIQAGIHSGEIDGKDAVFWLLKKVFVEKSQPDPFKGICVVFIPIVNIDGHERFGKWNRPNQVGPEEMGWRTTAQNFNMNRDFMKADAPEMQSLLNLWHKIDPVLSLDLHVTNGAQFRPEVGLIVHPHTSFGSTPLHSLGTQLESLLLIKMRERGHLALPFYPSFEAEDDPTSGFARYVSNPRFAHGYWYNANRLGILVESHSWKNYETRVRTHFSTVLSALELTQIYGKEWEKTQRSMDQINLSSQDVDLEFQHTEKHVMIDFPGYEYKIIKSDISGDKVIRYNSEVPQNWRVPFYEEMNSALTLKAPKQGYIVPAADTAWVRPKLETHGIKYSFQIPKDQDSIQVFKAIKTEFSPAPFEGHQTLKVEGEWKEEKVQISKGSIFVPINQPKARLILHLMEPKAKDSLLSWGFFNRYFERKEYMEHYVTQDVATEMLKNPEIKKEFEEKLKTDKDFASNPNQRFEFFYRKHPSWDLRYNMYPIIKL